MLAVRVRVRELRAIEELKKVEGGSAFTDALAKSASGTVNSLVTDPGRTVENIATGAGTVLGRIGDNGPSRGGPDRRGPPGRPGKD